MKLAGKKRETVPTSLFDGPDDDLFAGMNLGDGVYPEPTDEDRRAFPRIMRGSDMSRQITELQDP